MHFLLQLLTRYSNTAIVKQLVRLLTVDKISVNDYLERQTITASVFLDLLYACVLNKVCYMIVKQEHQTIN